MTCRPRIRQFHRKGRIQMMLRVVLWRKRGRWWTRTKLLDTADMREPDIRISIAVKGKYIVMDREMMRAEYAGSTYSQ